VSLCFILIHLIINQCFTGSLPASIVANQLGNGKFKDLSGMRFGYLTVIQFHKREKAQTYWQCLCDCGNTKIAASQVLQNDSKNKSCGCMATISQARLDEYVKLYGEGYNTSDIARVCGTSSRNIYSHLSKRGLVDFRSGDRGINLLKNYEEWLAQYKFGLPLSQIAKKAKRCQTTISRALRKQGVNLLKDVKANRLIKRESLAETIFEVYRRGYCYRELACVFDVSDTFIMDLLNEFYSNELRTKSQVTRLARSKESAITDNRQPIYIATDRDDLKPITHKTKDLTWGQDDNAINRRIHII